VAGKGLASAMIASSLRSAFRAIANTGVPLTQLAAQLNELHYAEGVEARRRYFTAAFFRFDRRTHHIEVVNAAHPPVFLVSAGGSARQFEAASPPIGLFPGLQFPSETAVLAEGDRLLAYTDGLSETRVGYDEYGTARLLDFFSSLPCTSAEDVLDQIWRQIRAFCGESHPEDDMTALTLLRPTS
jgi:serine phosphatase RsbU (regulator of sigma subunit)